MQRFIEPDHVGTGRRIAAGAHFRRLSYRHVDICLVPTLVVAAFTEQSPMQVQNFVASGTFQQVVDVLGGVPLGRSCQGEVNFVWFRGRQGHPAFLIPISHGLWVVLKPLWSCVFFDINSFPQAVFGPQS